MGALKGALQPWRVRHRLPPRAEKGMSVWCGSAESMAKQGRQQATSRTAGGPSRLGRPRPAIVNGLRPAVLNGVRLKVVGRLQLELKLAAARTGEGRLDQLRKLLEDVHGVAAPAARREDHVRSLP